MAKIMLVEDDNNLREIYEARLMAEGYEIVTARDGEEALAVAVKERPDLVISDVMMPKISGFDMLDILRSTPETKDVKVIMMTALSQVEDKERATKLGADRYLVKSQVTLEDVAKVAREVLEGTPAGAASSTMATAGTEPIADPALATAAPAAAPQPVQTPAEPTATAPAAPVTQEPPVIPAAPVMDPVTMPAATPTDPVVTDTPGVTTTPSPADAGITDLSAPAADPVTTPVDAPAATTTVQDNDLIKSPAEVWAIDTPAAPAPAADTSAPEVKDEVATAEAKIESTDVQSLEDEEAAIAKQIETMIKTPTATDAAPNPEPQPSTASADPVETPTSDAPTTDTPAPEVTQEAPVTDTPAPETTSEPASSTGQKVIQPLEKPAGPSIHELAAKEEAKEAGNVNESVAAPTGGATSSAAPTSAEPPKPGGIDPNSLAL